jgi:protein-S-isoprenylcysteine O-methyltransferase Ste14
MKQKHFIDSHKGATLFFCLGMIALYDQWGNSTAWIYLATHGIYGIMWILKSLSFPDSQWEQRCGVGYGLYIWSGLSLYWITPWLICAEEIEAPGWWLALCVSVFSVGVFFHFASDMQKHTALKLKRGLITDGLWARSRNPNYFGELLIYVGFGALAYTYAWVPASVLALFLIIVWIPNMRKKDASLSRYPEFEKYKRESGLMFPRIF